MDKIDNNNDGFVAEDELKVWIKAAQKKHIFDSVEQQWKDFDMNNDGLISWDEYKNVTYGSYLGNHSHNQYVSLSTKQKESQSPSNSRQTLLQQDRERIVEWFSDQWCEWFSGCFYDGVFDQFCDWLPPQRTLRQNQNITTLIWCQEMRDVSKSPTQTETWSQTNKSLQHFFILKITNTWGASWCRWVWCHWHDVTDVMWCHWFHVLLSQETIEDIDKNGDGFIDLQEYIGEKN